MITSKNIAIREVEPFDLDIFYENQRDPEANRMAAFVGKEPRDRPTFDAHWQKILNSSENTTRTIVADGQVAGSIACYPSEGHLEVTYWIGRKFWGRGVATEALRRMLELVTDRPIFARAAADNIGSLRVLQKGGFSVIGREKGFAHGRGEETEEYILRLDLESPAASPR